MLIVVAVIVTPACVAMPIAIDPVAVLVSISPLIVRAAFVWPMIASHNATRYAYERSKRAQYRCPIKYIHLLVLRSIMRVQLLINSDAVAFIARCSSVQSAPRAARD
jgi:hypothetical protein